MKKILGLITAIFLCCSFSSRSFGNVIVTIISFTNTTINSYDPLDYYGHSFIHIKNDYSWPLQLPFSQLGPFCELTLGLWGTASSGSDSSSSNGINGIFYNREAFVFSQTEEEMLDAVYLTIEVPTGLFNSSLTTNGSHLLERACDSYDGAFYNCSSFAVEFFNLLSNDFDLEAGVVHDTPGQLRNDILAKKGSSFENSNITFSSYNYWKFNQDGTCLTFSD